MLSSYCWVHASLNPTHKEEKIAMKRRSFRQTVRSIIRKETFNSHAYQKPPWSYHVVCQAKAVVVADIVSSFASLHVAAYPRFLSEIKQHWYIAVAEL